MANAPAGAQPAPRAGNARSAHARIGDLRSLALAAAALATLAAANARAETWDIVPALRVTETYSDNIALAPDALKRSDWVTQVIPSLSVSATGPRLRFNANYAPEFLHYADTQLDDNVFQRGNALLNAELARNLFFVDGGASVDQYNTTLQGPLTANNVNITGNRATATSTFVSPYLERDFGPAFRGEARYTYSTWRSDAPNLLADNDAQRVSLRLASGPAYKVFTWGLGYRKEAIEYETRQEMINEVLTADARQLITATIGVLAQAGYERYDTGLPGANVEDTRWHAGLEWNPTSRTRIVATGGQRFFGDTYGFELRHRARRSTWNAGYSEDVTTARAEFFVPAGGSTATALDQLFVTQFPDPAARQKAVSQFIAQTGLPPTLGAPINFFTDQLYLVKRGQASAAFAGVRHTLLVNAYTETRYLLFAGAFQGGVGDFTASNDIRQTGGTVAWNWRVTERNAWNLGVAFLRREFLSTERVDDLAVVRAGVSYFFQPKLSGSLEYRRQENTANQGGLDYTENAGIASLQARF
jgi:uncharacterized protein (PEP-CTERM system associated)